VSVIVVFPVLSCYALIAMYVQGFDSELVAQASGKRWLSFDIGIWYSRRRDNE
jgi:hypothetical protein